MTAERIKQRLSKAKAVRLAIEDRLDDCYRYGLPGRAQFNQSRAGGGEDDIFDETAVVAIEDYASVIHDRMTPDNADWVSMAADGSVHEQDRAAVNRDLEEINRFLFEQVHASNFSSEAQEAYLDLGCSTGILVTQWDSGLVHSSVPLTQAYLEAGADDTVGGLFRVRDKVRLELIPPMYPRAEISPELGKLIATEPDREVSVTDALWRVYSGNMDGLSAVVVNGSGLRGSQLIQEEPLFGMGSIPFSAFRFSKAAGEIYGRGPLMKVMSGIKTTNLVIELMLQNAAMAMVGIYQIENDSQMNIDTIRLEPGAIIPHARGAQGLRRVDTGSNSFNVAGLILEDQRRNIKRGMYSDALADPNRTPATASEIMVRTQELAGRISANVGRLRTEFIVPYWRRVLHLHVRAGLIQLPIPIEKIVITPEGPLARAVRQQGVNALVQHFQTIAGIYGPQIAASRYDMDRLDEFVRRSLGSPLMVMADPATQQQQAGVAVQAMQAQAQGGLPA